MMPPSGHFIGPQLQTEEIGHVAEGGQHAASPPVPSCMRVTVISMRRGSPDLV